MGKSPTGIDRNGGTGGLELRGQDVRADGRATQSLNLQEIGRPGGLPVQMEIDEVIRAARRLAVA
jgi:hypothetical protein